MSRGEFLTLGGAGLVGAILLPGVAGCGGEEGQKPPEETMISDPEKPEATEEAIRISTPRGTVRGVFYPANGARGAVVMVGGAGGGTHGPSGIYEELATRLQRDGAAALRLEYRVPNYLDECVYDVLAAIAALGGGGLDPAVLVGWSFGGAVVISAGAESDAVVGVATVASQTYGAGAVGELSPNKSLLLLHGTADQVLPHQLSRDLYARAGDPKELVLYPDDSHGIERHRSEMLEKLREWSLDLLQNEEDAREVESAP